MSASCSRAARRIVRKVSGESSSFMVGTMSGCDHSASRAAAVPSAATSEKIDAAPRARLGRILRPMRRPRTSSAGLPEARRLRIISRNWSEWGR